MTESAHEDPTDGVEAVPEGPSADVPDMSAALGASLGGMMQLLDRLNGSEVQKQAYAEAVGESQYAADLRRAFEAYQHPEQFAPGDLVQWRPLLKNRPYPADGAPAVVVRYLPGTGTPGVNEQSEQLDVELGFLDGEQSFLVFAYASARFTRWIE